MTLEAVVFDLDGVLTDTASLHLAAWRDLFDPVLTARGQKPLSLSDYRRSSTGAAARRARRRAPRRPRDRAARGRRERRPRGADRRRPGRRQGQALPRASRARKAAPLPEQPGVRERGTRRGGAHRRRLGQPHARQALAAAGLTDLFDAVVDGIEADRLGLPGKPDPALFLEAAHRLEVAPARAAVIEDAEAGVEAGRRGDSPSW